MSALAHYISREPVRAYLYSLVGAILTALVVLGYVEASETPVLMAVFAAILAVPAVETARDRVQPVKGDTE